MNDKHNPKRVVLHIDQLVLNGIAHRDRHAVAAGLQRELARLLAEPEAMAAWSAQAGVARVRAAPMPLAAGAAPLRVGTRAAQAIHRAMKK
jgi:hypothetical protein